MHHAREVLDPEPEKGWLAAMLGDLRRPAPAFASAALLLAVSAGVYQQFEIADARQPRVEAHFVLRAAPRGELEAKALTVSRKSELGLKVDFAPSSQYASYQARIVSANGKTKYTIPLSETKFEDGVIITVPADSLAAEKYSLVIEGLTPQGAKETVAETSFALHFVD